MVSYKVRLQLLPTGSRGLQFTSYNNMVCKIIVKIHVKYHVIVCTCDRCLHTCDVWVGDKYYTELCIPAVY